MSERAVMAIQLGARRAYFPVRQLEQAGLLQCLVTDAAWPDRHVPFWARAAAQLSPRFASKVNRRTVRGVPVGRVRRCLLPNAVAGLKPAVEIERLYSLSDNLLGKCAARTGLRPQVVFNCFGNGGRYLDEAKRWGARIVTDFYSHPNYWETAREERARWFGWEKGHLTPVNEVIYRRRFEWLVGISDIYLCPSPAVADGLSRVSGYDSSRTRLVPYGAGGISALPPATERGRVLFAASKVQVAKGLPYLGEAARLLQQRNSETKIVVAGAVTPSLRARPELDALEFLGQLGPEEMRAEFARADVFCLPSLSEGSASVVYEALANGIPVVTTPSSGSIVRDGHEGYLIPERSGKAAAEAIAAIVDDRALRLRMSYAALAASREYNDEACGAAFIQVIRDALGASGDKHSGTQA
jgi:glycosyltransferase involved in cell wall biosynthesis